MDDFKSYCYGEMEMADILGITTETLRQRIYRGADHPPYQCPARGVYWFPKELFVIWAKKDLKVTYQKEVSNAS